MEGLLQLLQAVEQSFTLFSSRFLLSSVTIYGLKWKFNVLMLLMASGSEFLASNTATIYKSLQVS